MAWTIALAGIPIGAVTSQSLLDFFLIVLGILWLKDIVQLKLYKTNWGFHRIGIEWAILGYFLVVLFGVLFNSSKDHEAIREITKFTWVLHLYILIYAFKKIDFNISKWVPYFSVGFFLQSLYAIIGYFHGSDFITGRYSDRVLGLLNSSTYHAHAFAVIFIFFLASLFFKWNTLSRFLRFFSILSILTVFVGIYLTYTRGIWFSIAASTLFMLGLYNRKLALRFFTGGVLAIIFAFFVFEKFHDRILHSFSLKENSERVSIYKANLDMFINHPIFGVGPSENTKIIADYWEKWGTPDFILSHAHNQFLNVLSTVGILGFIFFIWFWYYFLSANWNSLIKYKISGSLDLKNKKTFILFTCLWAQVEFYLACLTDVSFEYAKIRILIIFVWAMMISILNRDFKNEI